MRRHISCRHSLGMTSQSRERTSVEEYYSELETTPVGVVKYRSSSEKRAERRRHLQMRRQPHHNLAVPIEKRGVIFLDDQ